MFLGQFRGQLGGALVFVGWMASILGFSELNKGWHSHPEPQPMTCQELATNGPVAGLYIRLTDYQANVEGGVVHTNSSGSTQHVDVPLSAHDGDTPLVIARFPQSKLVADDLPPQALQQPLTGLVHSWKHWPEGRQMLHDLNPGFDPATCWVIEFDSRPPHVWAFLGIVFLGIGLFAGGVLLLSLEQRDDVDRVYLFYPLAVAYDGARCLAEEFPWMQRMRGLLLAPLAASILAAGGYGVFLIRSASPLQPQSELFWVGLGTIFAINFGAAFVLLSLYWLATDKKSTAEIAVQ